MMYTNDAKLFGKAILEGVCVRFNRELSDNVESERCSEAHTDNILDLIAKAGVSEKKSAKMRLIAILIAAALLLVGCTAYMYRNEIGSFVEHIYEDYVNVEIPNDDKHLTEIEHVYILSYVPEGYKLTEEVVNNVCVMYTFESEFGEKLFFDQTPESGTWIGIDNDGEGAEVFVHNGVEMYLRVTEEKKHYVWCDGGYVFKLVCSKSLDQSEILKIIGNMK